MNLAVRRELVSPTRPDAPPSLPREPAMTSDVSLLDPLELEALALNMEASLRVYSRHHFANWTQGLLQNLVRHDILVCARYNRVPSSFHAEACAAPAFNPAAFVEVLRRDPLAVQPLLRAWEENRYQPVIAGAGSSVATVEGALARELAHGGATTVMAHGTYDAFGKAASFFVFARRPGPVGPRQSYLLELIVPFVHAAWLRTQISSPAEEAVRPTAARRLTEREQEILKWVYQGKTNAEIGMILGISMLTVKNHVQKILRKLDVQNRAQAVGKALAQRLLNL